MMSFGKVRWDLGKNDCRGEAEGGSEFCADFILRLSQKQSNRKIKKIKTIPKEILTKEEKIALKFLSNDDQKIIRFVKEWYISHNKNYPTQKQVLLGLQKSGMIISEAKISRRINGPLNKILYSPSRKKPKFICISKDFGKP